MNKILCALICMSLVLGGCASSQLGWKAQPKSDEHGKESPDFIEDFDPKTLHDEPIVVTSDPEKVIETQNSADPSALSLPKSAVLSEQVNGFRVQLMLSKDETSIQEEKRAAMMKFNEAVYVVFESPYYKIRVGDFLTRADAEVFRRTATNRYNYQGAFLVPCKVNRRPGQ